MIPAHMRQFPRIRQSLACPAKQPRTASLWRLGASFQHPLHSNADTKKRNATLNAVLDCGMRARVRERPRGGKVPDARQDDLRRSTYLRWITGNLTVLPQPIQRLLHRDEISCTVVDYCDHHNTPLVEGRSRCIR